MPVDPFDPLNFWVLRKRGPHNCSAVYINLQFKIIPCGILHLWLSSNCLQQLAVLAVGIEHALWILSTTHGHRVPNPMVLGAGTMSNGWKEVAVASGSGVAVTIRTITIQRPARLIHI